MYYAYFVAPVCAAVSVIGSIGIVVVPWKARTSLLCRVGSFLVFMVLFLGVGMVFNGIWSSTIWGRLYYSTDYVFDFLPFWPITQSVIDAPFGQETGRLMGVTLFQLQLVWGLFAFGVWGTTFFLWRWLRRRFVRLSGIASKVTGFLAFILILASLLTAASVWNLWAPDRLYHYRYGGPPLIGGFLPPFTDPWEDLGLANPPGHYIWPTFAVYGVWLGFIAVAVVIPVLVMRRIARERRIRLGPPENCP